MTFTGKFETHITMSLDNKDGMEALRLWGIDHGLNFLHIVLERGNIISQPMLTHQGQGNFTDKLKEALDLVQALKAANFSAIRVKIEAAVNNEGIPQNKVKFAVGSMRSLSSMASV